MRRRLGWGGGGEWGVSLDARFQKGLTESADRGSSDFCGPYSERKVWQTKTMSCIEFRPWIKTFIVEHFRRRW